MTATSGSLVVERLRVDDLDTPLAVAGPTPALSWSSRSNRRGQRQSAYEVRVASSPDTLVAGRADLWATGRRASRCQRTRYAGEPLESGRDAYWQVRVWDARGVGSAWSRIASFGTGPLGRDDWSARWISHPDWVDPVEPPEALPVLVTEFECAAGARRARLHVAGVGVYVATLNGRPVTDAVLEPPYSDVQNTVDYATYDVTPLLRTGRNALGIELGTGIAAVFARQDRYTKFVATRCLPRAIAQLHVIDRDGRESVLGSDSSWWAALGPTLASHWYGGEDHDARRELVGWNLPATDRSGWRRAVVVPFDTLLTPRQAPPIRVLERVPARVMTRPAEGVHVFDLGTNIAGWPQVRIEAPEGLRITLLPGELLDRDGRVSQHTTGAPIRDTYVTTAGARCWHPRFTYHGFRYLEVHGLPETASTHDVTGLALRADNQVAGDFACSDPLLERIHALIDRAVRGNMFSVLTDCPHREKLGWLEQTHLLFPVVSGGYDIAAYGRDLARRVGQAQTPEGMVPTTAPEHVRFDTPEYLSYWDGGFRDDPNWGGALVLLPWQLYRAYGDETVLREHYDGMRRYVEYLTRRSEGGVLDYGLGDWITIDESTPRALAATWGYHRAVAALARIARVLGHGRDADAYAATAGVIVSAFHREFAAGSGVTYGSGSQACDAFALDMGAVPDDCRAAVLGHLVTGIVEAGHHLTVGEIALPALFRVLSAARHDELLYRVATRTDHPSYGYQLVHGATSLTEAWDGPVAGMSQNHFMLGAVDEWFRAGLAGIDQPVDSVGYQRAILAPRFVADLEHVAASLLTPHGRLASAWRRRGDLVRLQVEVPVGTVARVRPPALVNGPGWLLRHGDGTDGAERTAWTVGSGAWCFTARPRPAGHGRV